MEKFLAARRARQQAELALLNRASAKPAEPKPEPSMMIMGKLIL